MKQFFLFTLLIFTLVSQEIPKLHVTGKGEVKAVPDHVSLIISVVTEGKSAEEALNSNKEKMDPVFKKLKERGFESGEYKTGNFTLNPKYIYKDNQSIVDGYEAINVLIIETDKLSEMSSLVDVLVKSGINRIDNVTFSLNNSDKGKLKALDLAIKQAFALGRQAAESANVKLRKAVLIEVDPASNIMPLYRGAAKALNLEANISTPIEPGDISIQSQVTITFEID